MDDAGNKRWRMAAGISGFLAVVMGAVGAHAVDDAHVSALAEKASLYQLIHSAVLLWLADKRQFWLARLLMASGMVLFCGSLYVKALTGWPAATTLAPLGGVCLMAGWVAIAFMPGQK